MSFKSKSQMRLLAKKDPKVAAEFARGLSNDSMNHLPEHVSDLGEEPKSWRYASDKNVKKNVEDASMDLDKFARGGVLERLIEDLQELEFDKKIKPKMVKLEMHGGDSPAESKKPKEDDDDSKMDPRLAKIMKAKKGK